MSGRITPKDIDIELRPGSTIEHTLPNGTRLRMEVYKKRGRARLVIRDAATGEKIQTMRAVAKGAIESTLVRPEK